MKLIFAALLVLFAQIAHATPCVTPSIRFEANAMTLTDNVAHFTSFTSIGGGNDCSVLTSASAATSFDFGDGQTLQLVGLGLFVDHTYAFGHFVATVTQSASMDYLAPNFLTCNGINQTDCTRVPYSYSDSFTRTFDI
jgi:hypothetical protein